MRLLDWRGEICVIVASGPSAKDADIEQARGLARVIAVNNSWRLAPWADVLYGFDFKWWESVGGCPEFLGLKLSANRRTVENKSWGVKPVDLASAHIAIGNDKNSGFQALNIATQFWARRIILVGYDMSVEHGLHWHGPHGKGLNNPTRENTRKWRKKLDSVAGILRKAGVEVINASPISALEKYPKMSLAEALDPPTTAEPDASEDGTRVYFVRNFIWTIPERRRTVMSFKAGSTRTVRNDCAAAAIASGRAVASS